MAERVDPHHPDLADVHAYAVPDSPKMLRETLCVAQGRIGQSPLDAGRRDEHVQRLQRLIDECDRKRPLGSDGKHDDLHTPECGCGSRSARTVHTADDGGQP